MSSGQLELHGRIENWQRIKELLSGGTDGDAGNDWDFDPDDGMEVDGIS